MSCPLTTTLPESGRSSRLMQRTSVDLPAPDMPMTPKMSPSAMDRLMSSSAATVPAWVSKCLVRCFSSIIWDSLP